VGRTPDDYGGAVLESVLERAGLDMDLRDQFGDELGPPAEPSPISNTAAIATSTRTSYARRRATGAAR
jgi:hypothetical protein